jgi:alkane 1-monooxygenase
MTTTTTTTATASAAPSIISTVPFVLAYVPLVVGFAGVWAICRAAWWGPWLVPGVLFGVLPLVDALCGEHISELDQRSVVPNRAPLFDAWLWTWLPLQVALLLWAMSAFAAVSSTSLWQGAGLVVGVGLVTGIGINVAHELMHRRGLAERALAELLMMTTSYTHFCVEHVLGHHKHVSTPEDPASAPLGMSLWRYLPKTLWGGLRSAWRLESKRVSSFAAADMRGLRRLRDRRVRYPLAYACMVASIVGGFGAPALLFFVLQSVVAMVLLETINYVEHYGLRRQRKEDGTYERCLPHHSWNAPQRLSYYLLFALQRHSDHHHVASRPYYALRHASEAPQLPAGYPAMVVLALIPPLWRRVMDARAIAAST